MLKCPLMVFTHHLLESLLSLCFINLKQRLYVVYRSALHSFLDVNHIIQWFNYGNACLRFNIMCRVFFVFASAAFFTHPIYKINNANLKPVCTPCRYKVGRNWQTKCRNKLRNPFIYYRQLFGTDLLAMYMYLLCGGLF